MYPRNAASPPRIAIGAVVQISDGAVQSSGVSVVVRPEGGSETAGGGTISYGASSNVVYYVPTQAETDYTAFVVVAYKTGCLPAEKTIITTAESTAGTVRVGTNSDKTGYGLADGAITAAKLADNAITDAKVASDVTIASVTGAVGSVTGNVGGNVTGTIGGLSTQAKADVNAEVDTALSDVGVTTTVTGRIDVAVSTRLADGDYTVPLDAAGTRAAVGLASANLDTQLGTIDNNIDEVLTDTGTTIPGTLLTIAGYIDTEIAAIKAKTDNLPSDPADQSAVEAAITAATSGLATSSSVAAVQSAVDALPTLAEFLAGGDVDGYTLEQSLKLILSACAAKLSGAATTTITIRAADDSKDRITATVDSDGNRSAVTLDATG